jgi:hypothetical protein
MLGQGERIEWLTLLSPERIMYPHDREQRGREDMEICMNDYAQSTDMNEEENRGEEGQERGG